MNQAAFYGQVKFYFVLDLPHEFPWMQSQLHGARLDSQERTLALALISPAKLEGLSRRMPAYQHFSSDEIVDISTILGLVGRVWDDAKRRWLIVGRPDVMEQVDGATYNA